MIKVECIKCAGRGEISAFKGIAGGVCFSCNGAGFKLQKSEPKKSQRFGLFVDGSPIFFKKARSQKEAEKKIFQQFAGSPLHKSAVAEGKEIKIALA